VPSEQKIRGVLFYLSLFVFLIGLPFILAFALSYKSNPHTLRFIKAGLIALKTQPSGARVYLNGKLLDEKTPVTFNELLPGKYAVKIELEQYYPWSSEVNVSPGKATLLDKIILFPLRPNIEQVNRESASVFWLDSQPGDIYYINTEGNIIYRSDLDGNRFQEIGNIPMPGPPFKKYKISPDRMSLLCFNTHQIAVVDLKSKIQNNQDLPSSYFILNYPRQKITDVFWHSDSYHIIVVTDRGVEALEAKPKALPVSLAALNRNNTQAFYQERTDTLYFLDSERAPDGKFYDNVYKLELNARVSAFGDFMKLRDNNNEQ